MAEQTEGGPKMNLTYFDTYPIQADAPITNTFTFIKNIFLCEEFSSRVDLVREDSTGHLFVLKEYTVVQFEEAFKRGLTDAFNAKCDAEMKFVFQILGKHPNLVEARGWFRGGWPEGKESPKSTSNWTVIYRYHPKTKLPPTLENLKFWFEGTAAALNHVHSTGVIFTNFKLDNIIYDAAIHRVVLIDFGDLTINNGKYPYPAEGSGLYKAPEQISGEFGYAADFYSVGLSMVQWIYGDESKDTLTGAERDAFWEKLKSRTEDEKTSFWETSLGFKNPAVSDPLLWDFICQLTEYDPKKRLGYASALAHPLFLSANM